jgi:hypothetical protein
VTHRVHDVKLGKLIEDGDQLRDAVHVAVFPATAGEDLDPGDRVGLRADGRVAREGKRLGIVDPYLEAGIKVNQRFWVFLFPQTITSLRHEWTHPEFPDTQAIPATTQGEAVGWVTALAGDLGYTYEKFMTIAKEYAEWDEYVMDNSEAYKDIPGDKWRQFWNHYEAITGEKVKDTVKEWGCPFTCSC